MADDFEPIRFGRGANVRTEKLSELSATSGEVPLWATLAQTLLPRLHRRMGGEGSKFGNFDTIGRFGHIGGWLAVYQDDELLRLIEAAQKRLAPAPSAASAAARPQTAPSPSAAEQTGPDQAAGSAVPSESADTPAARPWGEAAAKDRADPAASLAEWWQRHRNSAAGLLPWHTDGLPELVGERLAAGSLRDALMQVLTPSQSPRLTPRALEETVVEVLALVRAGELRGEADAELVTDVLVLVLSRVRSTPMPDAYRQFILQLYGVLWQEIRLAPNPGNVQSLATLGDVAGRVRLPGMQRLSVAVYEACLRHIAGGLLGTGDDGWKRARIAANNISSHVSELAKFDGGISDELGGDELDLAYLLSRLQAINTVGSALTAPLPPGLLDETDWALIGVPPPANPHESVLRHAMVTIVRSMNNVLSSWIFLDPLVFGNLAAEPGGRNFTGEAFNLVLSTFGSLVRSRMADATGKDYDEASSSLFNSGLAVTRLRRHRNEVDQAWMSAAEMSYYAMGLVWALARASDLDESLGPLHGSSCLVNLLGSAARIETLAEEHKDIHNALSTVVALAAQWARAGRFEGADAGRIESSLSNLGKRYRSGRPAGVDSNADAAARVQRLWEALVQVLLQDTGQVSAGRPLPPIDSQFTAGYPLQFSVLAGVLQRGGQPELPVLAAQLRQVLDVLTDLVLQPDTALATLVARDDDGVTVVRRGLEALERNVAVGNRGVEWKADFAAITEQESSQSATFPYQTLLDQPGALQWLPGVQVSDRVR